MARPVVLWLGAFGILLASAVLMHAPDILFNVGVRNNDFDAHYHWAVQFGEGLRDGDLYPHWMWRGNFGLGEVALLYYSPLFYYVSGAVRLLTPNTWEAMRIVFVISTLLTGLYGWRLLRLFANDAYALVGAVLLQWVPMIFMLFYYFNGFPWAVGFAALVALTYYALRPDAFERWVDASREPRHRRACTDSHRLGADGADLFQFHVLVFRPALGKRRAGLAAGGLVVRFRRIWSRAVGVLSGPRDRLDGFDIVQGLDHGLHAMERFCLPHRNQPRLRHALVFVPMDGAGGSAARRSCRNAGMRSGAKICRIAWVRRCC